MTTYYGNAGGVVLSYPLPSLQLLAHLHRVSFEEGKKDSQVVYYHTPQMQDIIRDPQLLPGGLAYINVESEAFRSFLGQCIGRDWNQEWDLVTPLINVIHRYNPQLKAVLKTIESSSGIARFLVLQKEAEPEKILGPSPTNQRITPFRNIGNSCFIDSILFPILINAVLEKGYFAKLFEVSVEGCSLESLKNFASENTCSKIVEELKNCPPFKNLLTGDQHSDAEFLLALMDTFHLEPTQIQIVVDVSQDGVNYTNYSVRNEKRSILEVMTDTSTDLLEKYQNYTVNDFSSQSEKDKPEFGNVRYNYFREKSMIITSECLAFQINRAVGSELVSFGEHIQGSKKMELKIVTIHHGHRTAQGSLGHYTSFFRLGENWIYYDDMGGQLQATTFDIVLREGKKYASVLVYL